MNRPWIPPLAALASLCALPSLTGTSEASNAIAREEARVCTACHVRRPGSMKLTRQGKRYRWMMQDMEGIRGWLMSRHPTPPLTDPPLQESEPGERRGER